MMIPPEKLQEHAIACVNSLAEQLPKEIGCTVFLFQYGDNNGIGFATTAKKPQMIEVIRTWLRRQTMGIISS
jgi:hypothetical protein